MRKIKKGVIKRLFKEISNHVTFMGIVSFIISIYSIACFFDIVIHNIVDQNYAMWNIVSIFKMI